MSASQRRKGQGGEREAYALLADALGDMVRPRNLNQTRDGGGDIDCGNWIIEVKRRKTMSAVKWMQQAEAAGIESNKYGAVMFRQDGNTQWYVAVSVERFIEMVRENG